MCLSSIACMHLEHEHPYTRRQLTDFYKPLDTPLIREDQKTHNLLGDRGLTPSNSSISASNFSCRSFKQFPERLSSDVFASSTTWRKVAKSPYIYPVNHSRK